MVEEPVDTGASAELAQAAEPAPEVPALWPAEITDPDSRSVGVRLAKLAQDIEERLKQAVGAIPAPAAIG